ncbi:glycosyltransferase family 4 protein [Nostoc sp. C110]|uniref:glycosyltransferase family 4 protein n=1 Tax=Nostoc sp. C110 TaxID=3349876 RepID=UPI00370D8A97
MEKIANDTLSLWREEGSHLIQNNFEVFRSLLDKTKNFVERGKYNEAVVYGQSAALYAFLQHCGLFCSPELEQLFLALGQKTIQTGFYSRNRISLPGKVNNILHVATSIYSIGGHSRMIWRWIQQDDQRSHSLVLTQQPSVLVPKIMKDAVLKSHGKIYSLNETIGDAISWANRLHQIAFSADIVVLHIMPGDVIPIIAFSNKEQSPPIIFVNHADHGMWLGASISDVVANLRFSGMRLSQERRGIAPERNKLLPIILNLNRRTLTRIEAKRKLGIDENSVLLLSIARSPKYKTIDGISFADAHIPLLEKYQQAILIVIGANQSEDWSKAIQHCNGRIKIFPEREDTEVFYQAADIYVDSFPIVSNTSLLEAGSYGVPLVSRYPYSDVCGILGADTPGLDQHLIRVRDVEEYTAVLSQLVEDEKFRLSIGEQTKRKIVETHTGSNWQSFLEDVYFQATTLPRITLASEAITDRIMISELDALLPKILSYASGQDKINVDELIQGHPFPKTFAQKVCVWIDTIKIYGFGRGQMQYLLPNWLYWRLRKLISAN